MEQIRAAEYRARQFASQQLADTRPPPVQSGIMGEGPPGAPASSASAQNPALAAAVSQNSSYAMHGSPMPPQGPQVSFRFFLL